MPSTERPLAAQVVLRPPDGTDPDGPITAATLAQHRPAPATVAAVAGYFREAGFEVGELVGISFSIAAPAERFEALFGAGPADATDTSGAARHVAGTDGGDELPLDPLPREVAGHLRAVTFTPPPDFGPGGFA